MGICARGSGLSGGRKGRGEAGAPWKWRVVPGRRDDSPAVGVGQTKHAGAGGAALPAARTNAFGREWVPAAVGFMWRRALERGRDLGREE